MTNGEEALHSRLYSKEMLCLTCTYALTPTHKPLWPPARLSRKSLAGHAQYAVSTVLGSYKLMALALRTVPHMPPQVLWQDHQRQEGTQGEGRRPSRDACEGRGACEKSPGCTAPMVTAIHGKPYICAASERVCACMYACLRACTQEDVAEQEALVEQLTKDKAAQEAQHADLGRKVGVDVD